MVEGLFWSLLLVFFLFLAVLGWREYRKIEAYRRWAVQFDQAKYDIYSVLGQQGNQLTWGKPTCSGPIALQQIGLPQVESIYLSVDGQSGEPETLPKRGQEISLNLQLRRLSPNQAPPEPELEVIKIPFTEVELAAKWAKHLQKSLIAEKLG
jgi:hypothetical protein